MQAKIEARKAELRAAIIGFEARIENMRGAKEKLQQSLNTSDGARQQAVLELEWLETDFPTPPAEPEPEATQEGQNNDDESGNETE